jgi:hypothetical protein
MLQQVFDGRPPICVIADYDGAVIFLESNNSAWNIPPNVVKDTGFQEGTARYADPAIQADVSTTGHSSTCRGVSTRFRI